MTIPYDVNTWTARPSRLDEVASMLGLAATRRRSVLPCGAGSKRGWRRPPARVEMLVSSRNLTDWGYEPGSSTVTIGAGVPVSVAQTRLAAFGRRLPLDPPSSRATIGGVVATDELGPLSELYGTPAQALVGAWGVRCGGGIVQVGDTDPAHGPRGERFVETHAEPRLDWLRDERGSGLGVLVNATFRVTKVPAAQRWISQVVSTPAEAFELLTAVRARQIGPSAIEFDLPADGPGQISVLVEGPVESCMDRAASVVEIFSRGAHYADLPPMWWGRYPWGDDDVAVRLSASGSALRSIPYLLCDVAGQPIAIRGSIGMGVLHAALPAKLGAELLVRVLSSASSALRIRDGHAAVLSAPIGLADEVAPFRI